MSTGGRSKRAERDTHLQLTPCEFEVMEVLWRLDSATVRQVHGVLHPTRRLAYTTVMTVMDKLHRKGALDQRRQGRAYVYTARISQDQALQHCLQTVIRNYFQGSETRFLEYLQGRFGEAAPPAEAVWQPAPPAPVAEERVEEEVEEMDTTLL